MTSKPLPDAVTTFDILKTVIVLLMIIDHIGFYFFPDVDWFRAIGRICVPAWFFLIGYAHSRDLGHKLLIGAAMLAIADLILLQSFFPINILITILAVRLCLDYVMQFLLQSRQFFVVGLVLGALFFVATDLIMEYGTLGLMLATVGYLTRHKTELLERTFLTKKDYMAFCGFVYLAFIMLQNMKFLFSEGQLSVMAIGSALMMIFLCAMKPTTYPHIKNQNVISLLQFGGRKTLEIYVGHLLVFKVILFVLLALK